MCQAVTRAGSLLSLAMSSIVQTGSISVEKLSVKKICYLSSVNNVTFQSMKRGFHWEFAVFFRIFRMFSVCSALLVLFRTQVRTFARSPVTNRFYEMNILVMSGESKTTLNPFPFPFPYGLLLGSVPTVMEAWHWIFWSVATRRCCVFAFVGKSLSVVNEDT